MKDITSTSSHTLSFAEMLLLQHPLCSNRSQGKEHEFYQGRKGAQAIATARAKGALEKMW